MSREILKEVSVPLVQLNAVERMFSNDLVSQTAKGFLTALLLSKGGFVLGEEGGSPTSSFKDYTSKVLDPLIGDFVTHLICYGFVLYKVCINKHPSFNNKKVIYPVIVDVNYVEVKVITYSDLSFEYKVFPKEAVTGFDIQIFIHPGFAPDPRTGEVRSMIAPCLRSMQLITRVQELYLDALTQRAHPPFVLQETKDDTKLSGNDMLKESGASELMFKVKSDQERYEMEQYAINIQKNRAMTSSIKPVLSEYNGKKEHIANITGKRKIFYPTPVDAFHNVPQGWEPSSTQAPMPELVPDYSEMENRHSEKLLGVLRIPVALVLSIQRNRTDVTQRIDDSDYILMQKTVGYWREHLVRFVKKVHSQMFRSHGEVEVDLPTVPFINSTGLYQLHDQNIINTESLKNNLMDINGLSYTNLADKPNDITRPPIGGSVNDVTAMINANVESIKADAKSTRENIEISRMTANASLKSAGEKRKRGD